MERLVPNGHRVSVRKDKVKMNGGGGYRTM